MPLDLDKDAKKRYTDATALVKRLRKEWKAEGYPLLSVGGSTGKSEVSHPLIKMIADAEAQCHRFAEVLQGNKRPGREPVATPKPLKPSPAAALRAVDNA